MINTLPLPLVSQERRVHGAAGAVLLALLVSACGPGAGQGTGRRDARPDDEDDAAVSDAAAMPSPDGSSPNVPDGSSPNTPDGGSPARDAMPPQERVTP